MIEFNIKPSKEAKMVNCYELIINTMTGDADDYHKIVHIVDTVEELRDLLICILTAKKACNDDTENLVDLMPDFFEEYIDYGLYRDSCGIMDSLDDIKICYYDNTSTKCDVDYRLSKEARALIDQAANSEEPEKFLKEAGIKW